MAKKKLPKKWNDKQSYAYQMQRLRKESMEIALEERFVFISTFFGVIIEEGNKRISDYNDMTMADVTNEIKVRIQMLISKNNAKIKKHFKEQRKQENELLARLKASQ